ncbi:unnamed protein product, partial [Meganyctiphanes norvegica]
RYVYCNESLNCNDTYFNMVHDISTDGAMSEIFSTKSLEGNSQFISGNRVNSSVQFDANKPGQLQCLANNSLGVFQDNTTINIISNSGPVTSSNSSLISVLVVVLLLTIFLIFLVVN